MRIGKVVIGRDGVGAHLARLCGEKEADGEEHDLGQPPGPAGGCFDYYRNNAARLTTATQVTREVQVRPGALDHNPGQELIILPAPGEVLLFSGVQLQASIPNTFGRAVNVADKSSSDEETVVTPFGAPPPAATLVFGSPATKA